MWSPQLRCLHFLTLIYFISNLKLILIIRMLNIKYVSLFVLLFSSLCVSLINFWYLTTFHLPSDTWRLLLKLLLRFTFLSLLLRTTGGQNIPKLSCLFYSNFLILKYLPKQEISQDEIRSIPVFVITFGILSAQLFSERHVLRGNIK